MATGHTVANNLLDRYRRNKFAPIQISYDDTWVFKTKSTNIPIARRSNIPETVRFETHIYMCIYIYIYIYIYIDGSTTG